CGGRLVTSLPCWRLRHRNLPGAPTHRARAHGDPRSLAHPSARPAPSSLARRQPGNPRRSEGASGGHLREPADGALAQAGEIAHVDAGRGRDLLDRSLHEILGRVDVGLMEHAEDVLVDAVELEQLLVTRELAAALVLLAEVVLAAAAGLEVALGAVD